MGDKLTQNRSGDPNGICSSMPPNSALVEAASLTQTSITTKSGLGLDMKFTTFVVSSSSPRQQIITWPSS